VECVSLTVMKVLCGLIIFASLGLLAVPAPAGAQTPGEKQSSSPDASSKAEAASLQKKASEVQARIRANQEDCDELKKAVKINEVGLAKEILVRNGFTTSDLENTKISLRTGGGKGGEDTIEISAACCDPREITIRRTLENFTKSRS
jgi:hypothetical protein